MRTLHLAEILAATGPMRERSSSVPGRPRASASSPTRSCARTCATRPTRSAPSAPRVVAELPDWEELREAGRAIKADVLAHLDEYLAPVRGGGRRRPAARCTGRATRPRRTRSSSRSRGRTASTEVVKVKSLTTDEIDLNDALAAAGIHALETDFAELILQLDGDWSSHILVPAIHRNRTEIRDLFARTIADRLDLRRPARAGRGVARLPAREVPRARRWASAARTSASPRPARSASSSRRATAACARRCRRCS